MDTTSFLDQFGVVAYGLCILFGGVAGTKFLPNKFDSKYKFLSFSLIVAVIYILIEVFVQNNFKVENATKYLLTFCVVAVGYQYFLKQIFQKMGWVEEDEKNDKTKTNE